MPDDVDKPLAYAMNYLQASSAALHVLQRYLQRDQMDGAYYPWTTIDRHDLGMTVKEYVNFNVGPRLLQIETGLPLPDTFKMYAWNQLSVENGFTAECIRKRTAFKVHNIQAKKSTMYGEMFHGDRPHFNAGTEGNSKPRTKGLTDLSRWALRVVVIKDVLNQKTNLNRYGFKTSTLYLTLSIDEAVHLQLVKELMKEKIERIVMREEEVPELFPSHYGDRKVFVAGGDPHRDAHEHVFFMVFEVNSNFGFPLNEDRTVKYKDVVLKNEDARKEDELVRKVDTPAEEVPAWKSQEGDHVELFATWSQLHVIGMTTGYCMFTLLHPIPAGTTEHALCIDPYSIVLLLGPSDSPIALLALMVDFNIQMQAKFVDKLNKNRAAQRPLHAQALTHITPKQYTRPGQISILNMPMTHGKDQDVNSEFNNDESSGKVPMVDTTIATDGGVMTHTGE
ncbi:unnamed protein product, partial [Symbiodinium sp. KB8]